MSRALERFYRGLYVEHVETAGFLYEQWATRLMEAAPAARALVELEYRLEPHIDALLLGGERALAVALEAAAGGEAGERHIAARLFCRLRHAAGLRATLDGYDALAADDAAAAAGLRTALARALAWELPGDWLAPLSTALERASGARIGLLAMVAALRRLPLGLALLDAWPRAEPADREPIARALGRLPVSDPAVPVARELLPGLAAGEGEPVRAAAARALLRLGAPASGLALLAPPHAEALLNLALAGGDEAGALLLEACPRPAAIIALGLRGERKALEPLLAWLADPLAGAAATLALRLLTGAAPTEIAFVPESVTPEALFPREYKRWLAGHEPRADGRPWGRQLVRMSRNPDDWRVAIERLPAAGRIRAGAAASPATVAVPLLEDDGWPQSLKAVALDELAIRYGLVPDFDPEWPMLEQRRRRPGLAEVCALRSRGAGGG